MKVVVERKPEPPALSVGELIKFLGYYDWSDTLIYADTSGDLFLPSDWTSTKVSGIVISGGDNAVFPFSYYKGSVDRFTRITDPAKITLTFND